MSYFIQAESGDFYWENMWWWGPLWDYVGKTCGDILTKEDIASGHCNVGQEISASKSKKIAERLFELIESGHTANYQRAYYASSKPVLESNVSVAEDDSDVEQFLHNPLGFGKSGYSNESGGYFSEDQVKSFARFCEGSGGFMIF